MRPTTRIAATVLAAASLALASCGSPKETSSGELPKGLKPGRTSYCRVLDQFSNGPEQELVASNDIADLRKGARQLLPVVEELARVAPDAIADDARAVLTYWKDLVRQADEAKSVDELNAATRGKDEAGIAATQRAGRWALKNCPT